MNGQAQAGLALGQPPRTVPPSTDWLDVLPPKAEEGLRDYQRHGLAELAQSLRSYLWILMQAPTGAGKTRMIAAIIMAAVAAGLRILVLAPRTRLVRQIHEQLAVFEIRHGVIAAPLPGLRNYSTPVQVASVDTLYRRAIVSGKTPLPSADVVIFDEAHLAMAETRLAVLNSYPKSVCLGFTATPARRSGRSLGGKGGFQCLIMGPRIPELTAAGVLVPTRIYNTPLVSNQELRALPKDNDNDFQPAALGELLGRPKLVGDVLENWLRIAPGKRTLVFAVSKAHGAALLESFRRQGIAAEMLTDADDEQTREEIIGRLEAGDTKVVINCFLLSYGVDVPSIECIVLARPTRSLTMYLQMVGRGLRAAPGKSACILIDHGHVVENLGLPQSDHGWTLDPARNVNAETLKSQSRKSPAESARTCRDCKAMWLTSERGKSCPECGWTPMPKAKPVMVEHADLEELADDIGGPTSAHDPKVFQFYCEAMGWRARHKPEIWRDKPNTVRAWAWYRTLDRFTEIPKVRMVSRHWNATPITPSDEVAGWLKGHQQYLSIKARKSGAPA